MHEHDETQVRFYYSGFRATNASIFHGKALFPLALFD